MGILHKKIFLKKLKFDIYTVRESSCNQQNSYFNVIWLTNVIHRYFLYLKA